MLYFKAKRSILQELNIVEQIKSNGKCPITSNDCMCACEEDCFIDASTNTAVDKMLHVGFNSAVSAVSNTQLNNLPTEAKLKVADHIITLAKIRIGRKTR